MQIFKVLLATTVLLAAGCTTGQLHIQGGGFRNLTGVPIEQVELKVERTGEVASCSYIAPNGYFSTRFPLRVYRENPIVVRWRARSRNHEVGPFVIPVPDPVPNEPVAAVIRFLAEGRAEALFVPVSKIPARYVR